eukprot:scaffold13087_cov32-Cyclotella_meneghiniana.AAC.1
MDLSKTLGNRWKNVDYEIKEYCQKIADGELEKFRKEQEEYKNKYGKAAFDYQKKQKMKSCKKRKSDSDSRSAASNKRGKSEEERAKVKSQGRITEDNVQVPNEVIIHQNYSNQKMPSDIRRVSSAGSASSIIGHNGFSNAVPNATSHVYSKNLGATGLHGTTPFLSAIADKNHVNYYPSTADIGPETSLNGFVSNSTESTDLSITPVNGSHHSTQKPGSSDASINFSSDDSLKFGLDFKTFIDSEVEEERVEVESRANVTENNVMVPNEVIIHQNYSYQKKPASSIGIHDGFANALPNATSRPYSNAHAANLLPPIIIPQSIILNSMDHNNNHQNQVRYYVPTAGFVYDTSVNTMASDSTKSTTFSVNPVHGSRLSTQKFDSSITSTNFRIDDSPKFGLDFKTISRSELLRKEPIRDNSLKFGLNLKTFNRSNHSAVHNPEFKAFNRTKYSAVLNPQPQLKRCTSIGIFDGGNEPLPLGREVVSAFERHSEH